MSLIHCPTCGRMLNSLGYARHRTMHYDHEFRMFSYSFNDAVLKHGKEKAEKAIEKFRTLSNSEGIESIPRKNFEEAIKALARI